MLPMEILAIVTTIAGCSVVCRPPNDPLQRSDHDKVHAPDCRAGRGFSGFSIALALALTAPVASTAEAI